MLESEADVSIEVELESVRELCTSVASRLAETGLSPEALKDDEATEDAEELDVEEEDESLSDESVRIIWSRLA